MDYQNILFDISDGIATLTIDRAEKRNAMTYAMLGAFIGKVAEAGVDDKVRVLIVTGSGGAFCAGTDLADLATVPGGARNSPASAMCASSAIARGSPGTSRIAALSRTPGREAGCCRG